jgi:hypothetical protein
VLSRRALKALRRALADHGDQYVRTLQSDLDRAGTSGGRRSTPSTRGPSGVAGDDIAAFEIRWEGTHTGALDIPAGTVPASGNRISVDASFWARSERESIQEIHHHLDVLTLLRQIGALAG